MSTKETAVLDVLRTEVFGSDFLEFYDDLRARATCSAWKLTYCSVLEAEERRLRVLGFTSGSLHVNILRCRNRSFGNRSFVDNVQRCER